MKTKKLKQIISDNEFRIYYGDTDNLHNLPTFAILNHSTDTYHIEIEIESNSNVMYCEIWIKDKRVNLTDMQLDYIFNTFTDFLEQQIESVKLSFYEHKYL
tara:strand:+ start:480 stop:782 length:303 start_codon:yes stop_codon:yes gene_type:complete